jgi:hypothetical protein
MKKLRSLFIMDKSFKYKGSLEDLKQKMTIFSQSKKTGGITFDKNKSEYTIYANISFGTLMFTGGGFSIKIHLTIEESIPKEQIIRVYTYLRPENYFFGFAFILSFIVAIMSNQSLLPPLITIGIFVLTILWFNFIYKVQEEILVEKIIKQLKLRKIVSPIQ